MDEESNELPLGNSANDNEHHTTAESAFILDADTCQRPWGGVPFVYSYGDNNQVPPVAKKFTYDTRAPKTAADRAGRVAFHEFITTTNPSESMATVVVMEEVVRQTDEVFKAILQNMRDGTLNNDDIDILLSRMLENLPIEEKQRFQSDGLFLVPTWKEAHTINLEYIQNNLATPIARYDAHMETIKSNGKNCCINESNLPLRGLLCMGAKVMLVDNFIVEYKLMNGSVGVVQGLYFSNSQGQPDDKMYVVVNFPESTIPEERKLIPNMPKTCVPIPIVTRRCEKNCCSISAMPLQVCKALTIHKSQGMTISEGKHFKKVVVSLPVSGNKCPGLELVATSRAVELADFAIGNPSTQLTKQDLFNKTRRDFLTKIRMSSGPSQEQTRLHITALDQSAVTDSDKTFEGGCNFLLDWYRTTFPI
jgi:hypothetical protein